MPELNDDDLLIVGRNDTSYTVEVSSVMSDLQDTDLLVVGRDDTSYSIKFEDFKSQVGGGGGPDGGGIFPSENDIAINPPVAGSGTEGDPYILTTRISAPAGSTVLSSETISFNGQPVNTDVIWTDNSTGSGTRFSQPVTKTDANGDWSGQLQYADAPDSTGDVTYMGALQIGTLHFRWQVDQKLTDRIPTQVQSVDLVKSSDGADRFTNQSFAFTSIIDDGAPLPTKTIEAYVSGTFDTEVTPKSSNSLTAGTGDIVAPLIPQSNIISGVNSWKADGSPADYYAGEEWISNDTDTAQSNVNYIEFLNQDGSGKPHTGPFTYNTSTGYTRWQLLGPNGITSENTNGNSLGPFTQQLTSDVVSIRITCPSGTPNWSIKNFTIGGVDIRDNETTQGTIITLTDNTVVEATTGEDTGLTVPEAFTPGLAITSGQATGTVVSASDSEITVEPDADPSWVVNPRNSGSTSTNSYQWVYGNGIYVKRSEDAYPGLAWSTDGIAWTNLDRNNVSNDYSTNNKATSIAFGNGKFIAGRSSNGGAYEYSKLFLTSTDGKNWTASPAPNDSRGSFYNMYFGGDNRWHVQSPYVRGALLSKSWYSSNGTSWTGVTVNPGQDFNNTDQCTNYLEIISTGNKFVLFGQSGPQMLYYGNGTSWSRSSLNLGWPANQKQAWGAGNGVFIMAYYSNNFVRSTNGNSWTAIPGDWFPRNIVYNEALDVWYAWENNGDRIISRDNGQTFQLDAVYGSEGNEYDYRYEWSQREPENKRITFGINNNPTEPQFIYFVDAPVFKPGSPVQGATSTVETTKKYVEFNSNGNVSDLKAVPTDPPYTTTDTNPSLNLTFPSTFPSGETPDDELPEGTTLTVGVFSENVVNRSPDIGFKEATIQPALPVSVSDLFATTLYTGNGTSNRQSIITGIDNTEKSLVWIKGRSASAWHVLIDSVRGVSKCLATNDEQGEATSNAVWSLNANGFDVGAENESNYNDRDYVAWNFKAEPKFFDIQTWIGTGNGSGQIIPHNLTSEPACVIGKRTNGTGNWYVYHKDIGFADRLVLNEPSAVSSGGVVTAASNTEFTVYGELENATDTYVGYLFADEPGRIKCGTYTGAAGVNVDCGFKPQWVMIKNTETPTDWTILDEKRYFTSSPEKWDEILIAQGANAEQIYSQRWITVNDNGFQATNEIWSDANQPGEKFIYVAIAAPVVETMTAEQFAETQAKFSTYELRSDLYEGAQAKDKVEELTKKGVDPYEYFDKE